MREKRNIGKIENVFIDCDHDVVLVHLEFDGFSTAFGGMVLTREQEQKFLAALCRVAGVEFPACATSTSGRGELVHLVAATVKGREVAALWNLGENNEPIEGIESPAGGNRFTLTGFRRALGIADPGAKACKVERLNRDIALAKRVMEEAQTKLDTLDARWTEWGDGDVVIE